MDIRFPFQFDSQGNSAVAVRDDHIRQMIEQILFTSPGERVNRPDFGSGLLQLVFAPNSDQMAIAVQASVHGSLQQWLGDVIEVHELTVENIDNKLIVSLAYLVLRTGEERIETFERSVSL
jgi:phage baseplate assembly protein W